MNRWRTKRSKVRNWETEKDAVPGAQGPHVMPHDVYEANGPPDMTWVSIYTAGSSPKAAGEFWLPFKAPLPRCTAANQGARIVAEPHVATASPQKSPVPTD